jgi:4-phytase/acid phosphatase
MIRFIPLLIALFAVATTAQAETWKLERVVLVQRHGVRPPTSSNADLAKYAAEPWPQWPVAPGELTAHGAKTVALMGATLRRAYVAGGLIPARGCPAASVAAVWADQADQRTRVSGQTLAKSLAPGCGLEAAWASGADPVFFGADAGACHIDPDEARKAVLAQAGPGGLVSPAARGGMDRLQAVLAPKACDGGKGYCFKGDDSWTGARPTGPLFTSASLAEDLLLEYAEDMPASQVGWGRAPPKTIAETLAAHERVSELGWRTPYVAARRGGPMARVMLDFLEGTPIKGADGLAVPPGTRILALAGHDANVAFIGAVLGLDWTLPDEPDSTAPATTLALELWSDPASGRKYVRPVVYYETLDQLRTLSPGLARRLTLRFPDCASGPLDACPLATVKRRVEALVPPDCL